jgi:hypothetical protein
MSLYPYICKYFKIPVGHPTVHVVDKCKDMEACLRMDGLVKCRIVPRRDCTIPASHTDAIINLCSASVECARIPSLAENVSIPRKRRGL